MFLTAPMPEPEAAETVSERGDAVYDWRRDVLERAGYDYHGARMIARRREIDLHEAVSLLKNGCPESVALRILL
jgi:hypothetical protein